MVTTRVGRELGVLGSIQVRATLRKKSISPSQRNAAARLLRTQ